MLRMRDKPVFQAILAGLLAATAAWVAAAVDQHASFAIAAWPCVAFGAAVAAMFLALRSVYPAIVGAIAVGAILGSPQTIAMVIGPTRASYTVSAGLLVWGLLPVVSWLGIYSIAVGGLSLAVAILFFKVSLTAAPGNFLLIPEWHLVFALFGTIAAIRRRKSDATGRPLLAFSLGLGAFMPAALLEVMLAPLIGLGAGRLLYRGTLTKPFRIPPAGWAIALLAIAAVRSAVIMITWAPNWDEYKNRIGLRVNP